MGCLYKVTNTVNGKCYVGITLRTAKARWARHVYDALERRSKFLLHRAIRKHGPDAFTVRTLKKSDDWEQLCQLEIDAIKRYGTKAPAGYNLTKGGDGVVDPTDEECARRSETWKRLNADPEFAARRDATIKRLWADNAYRVKKSEVLKTTIQRLLAEGYRPGECTAFNDFCREHGLNGKYVRRRLRKRGLYGLKDINHPIVREVLDKMIAGRRTDTVPAKKPHASEGAGLTLH